MEQRCGVIVHVTSIQAELPLPEATIAYTAAISRAVEPFQGVPCSMMASRASGTTPSTTAKGRGVGPASPLGTFLTAPFSIVMVAACPASPKG